MLIFWAAKVSGRGFRFYSTTAAGLTKRSRFVDTLDPSKFLEKNQSPIYLSTPKQVHVTVRIRHDDILRRATSAGLRYSSTKDKCSGFPSHALGFLYFRPAQPHQPATAAEIRFRLAGTLERFRTGEDLKLPNGEPWHRPLFALVSSKSGRQLYDKLMEEGLISEDVHLSLMNLLSSEGFSQFVGGHRNGTRLLYSLSDPFTLDLSAGWVRPFGDMRYSSGFRPYKGTVRLRFEPSTLPQHAGTRTVVIRVLDVVHPIECVVPNYDGWIRKPQLGELVMQSGVHGPSPLSFNMDAPNSSRSPIKNAGTNLLRLLWENDPLLPDAAAAVSATSSPAQLHPVIYNGKTRLIKTLDPTKFLEKGQASIDMSGQADLRIVHPNGAHKAKLPYYGGKQEQRYPNHAVGFLYFQPAEANRPRISGGIRFRLASAAHDFAAGRDLEHPDGTVWQVPIFTLARASNFRALFEKIVEEGLIPQDLRRSLVDSEKDLGLPQAKGATVLYTLSDPFILPLSSRTRYLWAITEKEYLSVIWSAGITEWNGRVTMPYQGVIRARFEVSTLPEHAGTRTVVIRVLEVLEPIKPQDPSYSGAIPPPRAGELLMTKTRGRFGVKSFDLDGDGVKPSIIALLRLLWYSDVERRALPNPPH